MKRKNELAHTLVSDSVEGTREDGTYGPIKIKGLPLPEYEKEVSRLKRMEERYKFLQIEISSRTEAVEEFISSLDDPLIRVILRKKYIDRKTWAQVGRETGRSAEQCKKRSQRFFAKNTCMSRMS